MQRYKSRTLQIVAFSASSVVTVRSFSMSPPKIAVAQLCSKSSKLENLWNIAKCAGRARHEGCTMLFLPECFGFMGESAAETLAQAEPPIVIGEEEEDSSSVANSEAVSQALQSIVDGVSVENDTFHFDDDTNHNNSPPSLLHGLQTIARHSQLWISAGGMHVRDAANESKLYNTHVILDHHGKVQSLYRKIHLFDVHIPGKVDLRESRTTTPGDQLVVCDSPIGRLGLSTCYDVRFPEMYIELVNRGAEILLIPSAFTVPTGSAHWHTLLKARAIENQCFVIAAAQYGTHNNKRSSYGHSLVVNPWGDVLADAGGVDSMMLPSEVPSTQIITAEIDVLQIKSIQERMPIQTHRKNAQWT